MKEQERALLLALAEGWQDGDDGVRRKRIVQGALAALERAVTEGDGESRDGPTWRIHDEMRARAERAEALVAALDCAPNRDAARLDWWEKHLNYEHATDYEDGNVVLYRVTGNVNDRVWHQVARGPTLRAALDAVRVVTEEDE